jgi:hypothetical protein
MPFVPNVRLSFLIRLPVDALSDLKTMLLVKADCGSVLLKRRQLQRIA